MNLIFDIEADGLTPTKIWCIVAKELDGPVHTFDPTQIEEGIKFLQVSLFIHQTTHPKQKLFNQS